MEFSSYLNLKPDSNVENHLETEQEANGEKYTAIKEVKITSAK